MEIQYTKHAKWRCERRKIEKAWIEEALKNPDKIRREGKKYYIKKKLDGKSIEIVCVKERYIRIVTVCWV